MVLACAGSAAWADEPKGEGKPETKGEAKPEAKGEGKPEAKGEHGGFHEAAIGAGIFAGPAIGATAAHFLPEYPNSSAVAVSMALCGGLVGLLAMARHRR